MADKVEVIPTLEYYWTCPNCKMENYQADKDDTVQCGRCDTEYDAEYRKYND